MADLLHIYLLNLVVTVALFVATLYRIKIEKKSVDVSIQNARARKSLEILKRIVEREKDLILEDPEEFIKFLKEYCGNEN
jgi:hypothetical protein